LNHTDAVKRGIAMSTRLAEIKMEHELNDLDFATMCEIIDDTLPVGAFHLLFCCLCGEHRIFVEREGIFAHSLTFYFPRAKQVLLHNGGTRPS